MLASPSSNVHFFQQQPMADAGEEAAAAAMMQSIVKCEDPQTPPTPESPVLPIRGNGLTGAGAMLHFSNGQLDGE